MSDLDSRALCHGDSFAQRFANPGAFSYVIGPAGGPNVGDLPAPGIRVKEAAGGRKTKQHDVVVTLKEGHLVADPPDLEISAGDVVLWSAGHPRVPPFRVRGKSEAGAFDSASLERESVYTHAFGLAGEYEWRDANGHGLHGIVRVADPMLGKKEDEVRYKTLLSTGTMVVVRGSKVEPAVVEISVGQTVFFAVEDADGVTITDCRVLQRK